ncbi:MAG: hypothetical protein ACO3UM_03015 [Planctomycetota bacterium]
MTRPSNTLRLLAAILGGTLGAAHAQDPEPVPTERNPAVEMRIARLDDAWKDRKMERDGEAGGALIELSEMLDAPVHPKDEQAIRAALAKVLTAGRLRPADRIECYELAAKGLAKLGDDGTKILIQTYEKKRFPRHAEWAPMRAVLVEAVGASGSATAVPFLVERVQRGDEPAERQAAGAAMKGFAGADDKTRKALVEILARRLAGFETEAAAPAVNQDQQLNLNRENALRMMEAVRAPWTASLEALTGETQESGAAWQKWFQDHKRAPWPKRDQG